MTSDPRFPLSFQIVAAAVLLPPDSYLAAHITKTVCDYQYFLRRIDT
jgi:hypothetical protein